MYDTLQKYREELDGEFIVAGSGYKSGIVGSTDKLEKAVSELIDELTANGTDNAVIKAKVFEKVISEGEIQVNPHAFFCDRINHGAIVDKLFSAPRRREVYNVQCKDVSDMLTKDGENKAYSLMADFGHVCHDWHSFSKLGFSGTLESIIRHRDEKEKDGTLDKDAEAFYESCIVTYKAILAYIDRFAERVSEICDNADKETGENMTLLLKSLRNIRNAKPSNFHEALLSYDMTFYLSEIVSGTRVRTLGGIDRELIDYWRRDLANGTFTEQELRIVLRQFLFRLWAMRIPFDLPFMIGGIDEDGNCVVNELSYAIVEEYMKLDIHSPKIHVRVSDNTPEDFILLVLDSIRNGSSSFVFCNDNIIIKSLEKHSIATEDARLYLPIGCYEPAAAQEIACTGAGHIDLARICLITLFGGKNILTGASEGVTTSTDFDSFESFFEAFKEQFKCISDKVMHGISRLEEYFPYMNPNPLLSATYPLALKRAKDIYNGGAKYSNSSFQIMFLPTCVDIMSAIKTVVFEKKICTLDELREAITANFKGHEKLRASLLRADKYGNGSPLCSQLTKEISDFTAHHCINRPNGRGGVFRVGCFSIDRNVLYGSSTCATPDGRLSGVPYSKNLCTSPGMDKQGLTALINAACDLDHTNFANGTVLDIVLHPSAVSGKEGLCAFRSILKTYFSGGGFALHGNVFDAETLKKAQKYPEQYKNLQVRVCGWNVFFVNLSKIEQDMFIAQAEAAKA